MGTRGVPRGDGGARRDRTADLYNAIVALSQLSYGPSMDAKMRRESMGGASTGQLPPVLTSTADRRRQAATGVFPHVPSLRSRDSPSALASTGVSSNTRTGADRCSRSIVNLRRCFNLFPR